MSPHSTTIDLTEVVERSRRVLRRTDAVFPSERAVLCAVATNAAGARRAADHLINAATNWGMRVKIEVLSDPIPARHATDLRSVVEGVHEVSVRLDEPGEATPVAIDPALALARRTASELRQRVDELEAENRRLNLALGILSIEKERLEKAAAQRRFKKRAKRT